jgi:hypothetical protein
LWVAWAGLLFGGYLLSPRAGAQERRMPRWTRLGSSLVLAIAAWVLALVLGGSPLAPYARLIALGMTLGFLGDLFMAHALPAPNHTLAGIAAFAVGHVAYIMAGLSLANILGLTAAAPRALAWLLWLVIGAVGWYLVIYRGQKQLDILDWAALPYALLLASTTGVATGLALQDARLVPLALGAALFLFSDLMIAAKLFAGRSLRWIDIDDLIWLTYGPGQMLIVYTTLMLTLFSSAL